MDGIGCFRKNMASIVIDFAKKNGSVSEEKKHYRLFFDCSWNNGRCASIWRVFLDTKGGLTAFH